MEAGDTQLGTYLRAQQRVLVAIRLQYQRIIWMLVKNKDCWAAPPEILGASLERDLRICIANKFPGRMLVSSPHSENHCYIATEVTKLDLPVAS